jgi:hypothetical protein
MLPPRYCCIDTYHGHFLPAGIESTPVADTALSMITEFARSVDNSAEMLQLFTAQVAPTGFA